MPRQPVNAVSTQVLKTVLIYEVQPNITEASLGDFCTKNVRKFLKDNGAKVADFYTVTVGSSFLLICAIDSWPGGKPWNGKPDAAGKKTGGVENYEAFLKPEALTPGATIQIFSQQDWGFPPVDKEGSTPKPQHP